MIRGLFKTDVVTITGDKSLKEAAILMRDRGVGDVIVVSTTGEGQSPVGVLTDRDIVVKSLAMDGAVDLASVKVEDVMTKNPTFVKETSGLFDTIRKMREAGVARIIVVDDNRMLLGLLTSQTIFDLLNEELHELGMIARSRRSAQRAAASSSEAPDRELQH